MTAHPELNTVWTADRLGDLRQLHSEGMSATLIARALNAKFSTGFSRNAIIGACHRAELPKRPSKALAGPPAIKRSRDHGSGALRSIDRRLFKGSAALPKQKISAAPFLGIALFDLEKGQCRFPRGENPTLFCGQPQQEDSSYCPHCHSITHEVRNAG